MDSSTNNILAHSGLYPGSISTTVSGLLSSSPTQDSFSRSSIAGQNSWGGYSGETGLVPHNSCSMASYGNLPLGASFGMNSKAAYNSAFGSSSDYINCRQMVNHMSPLNAMPLRNYGLYGDMYQGHTSYANGGFYPDMAAGIPPFPGRELDCRSGQSDSSQGEQGTSMRKYFYFHFYCPSFCLFLSCCIFLALAKYSKVSLSRPPNISPIYYHKPYLPDLNNVFCHFHHTVTYCDSQKLVT